MSHLQFRPAERGDTGLILRFIRALAEYEHMEDQVVATEELLEEGLFDKRAAQVVFAVEDGREISPPSWAGPEFIWRIYLFGRSVGAGAMARRCWPTSPPWPNGRAAEGLSGGAWTGTAPALISIKAWMPGPWTSGRCTV